MKPRHWASLLVVGMSCVMFYFERFASIFFLVNGLFFIYEYKGGIKEFEKIIVWQRGVRLKSLYFYGGLVSFFFLLLFFGL